ncbi:hypothetical protein F0562_015274 [Nyssa sinensis]|uniref:Uncharacterized protein n=1 Tax=Nyssa sinensis TaxID=561372 RepID=A0A5J4ZGX9_9ASTE|nr:hypothetical protein F0562_015274 [Nyssa sinensis]
MRLLTSIARSRLVSPAAVKVSEGPTIDVSELGLFRILVGILFKSHEYNLGYSLDREGSSRVPLKSKIFGVDGRIREVMGMVNPEKAPLSLTISIIDCFSSSIPSLIGVTIKRATQGSDDPKGKKISTNQKAPLVTIKLFQTLADMIKLAKVISHSLEHQVCYDFTRAMVDDAHESIKDELLRACVDLQESQEELSHTHFLLCHSREEAFSYRDNTVRLAQKRNALKVTLGENELEHVALCNPLVNKIQEEYHDQFFKFYEESYLMGYEDAQTERPLTFPRVEVCYRVFLMSASNDGAWHRKLVNRLRATNMRKIRHGVTRVEMYGGLAVGSLFTWVIPWPLSSLP